MTGGRVVKVESRGCVYAKGQFRESIRNFSCRNYTCHLSQSWIFECGGMFGFTLHAGWML